MAKNRTTVQQARERADIAEAKAREVKAGAQTKMIRGLMRASGRPRARSNQAMMAAGSYATERGGGIGRGRLRDSVTPRGGPADWHLDPYSLLAMRRDAQSAMRRMPLARITVKTLVRLVVGCGPSILPRTGDAAFNEKKAALLAAWMNRDVASARELGYTGSDVDWGADVRGLSTFDGMLRQAVRAAATDGDELASFTPSDGKGGGGQLVMTEAERVVSPSGLGQLTKFVPGEGGWVNGIELDGKGRAVRASVAQYSPNLSFVRYAPSEMEYADLTDGSAYLLRNPLDEAANQTRGEPALAAILPELDELQEYDASVVEAAATHAKITAIATSASPGSIFGQLPGITASEVDSTSATAAQTQEQRTLEPGTLFELGTGSDIKFPPPTQPGAQYQEFVLLRWGVLAADLGVPILLALMDPRETNYSGFRAAIGLAQKNFDLWREELERFIRFVETFKTAQWIREGLLEWPAQRGEWAKASTIVWPPMPMLDPGAEIKAGADAVAARLRSRTEVIKELTGRDAVDVDAELAEEAERMRTLGITPAVVNGAVGSGQVGSGENGQDKGGGQVGSGQSGKEDDAGGDDAGETAVGGRMGARVNGTLNGVGH